MVSLSKCAVFKGAETHFLLQDDRNVMLSLFNVLFLKCSETHCFYMPEGRRRKRGQREEKESHLEAEHSLPNAHDR